MSAVTLNRWTQARRGVGWSILEYLCLARCGGPELLPIARREAGSSVIADLAAVQLQCGIRGWIMNEFIMPFKGQNSSLAQSAGVTCLGPIFGADYRGWHLLSNISPRISQLLETLPHSTCL